MVESRYRAEELLQVRQLMELQVRQSLLQEVHWLLTRYWLGPHWLTQVLRGDMKGREGLQEVQKLELYAQVLQLTEHTDRAKLDVFVQQLVELESWPKSQLTTQVLLGASLKGEMQVVACNETLIPLLEVEEVELVV